jgi:xanthine dehydrogenase small subunit
MVECHGSQCGFCTPGFVMSLFHSYHQRVYGGGEKAQGTAQPVPTPITREQAQQDLSGNLCRCTGYRPMLDAAQRMSSLPAAGGGGRTALRRLASSCKPPDSSRKQRPAAPGYLAPPRWKPCCRPAPATRCPGGGRLHRRGPLDHQGHQRYAQVLDVTRAAELRAWNATRTTSPLAPP